MSDWYSDGVPDTEKVVVDMLRDAGIPAITRLAKVVYVTAEIDPAKTVVARQLGCGCPVYAEDLPIREWRCEHGNYWLARR